MKNYKMHTVLISLAGIVTMGTVFFRFVEGWSWLDSYFFTVITISTVGYGKLVPITALGKIGTTAFIFVGLGIFAAAIQHFARYHMKKREEHTEWLIARLSNIEDEDPLVANEDTGPEPDAPRSKRQETIRQFE